MSIRRLALGAIAAVAGVKVAADLAVRSYEDVPLQETSPQGLLAWRDSVRVHYLDEGRGPALVLLHGLGASTYSYRRNLPELAKGYRVVVPDMPGYGLSSRDAPDLSLTAQAGYLAALLDHLGIERASLVGHSMGGSVVQRFAATWPERVDRLALIASTTDGFMGRASVASRLLAPFIPVFVTAVLHNEAVRRVWLRRAVYDPDYLTPEIIAAYEAPGHIVGHTAAYKRLMLDRRHDMPIDASLIAAPTLIIWGDTDRVVSIGHGERLTALIPHSRLTVVPRAGHLVQEEQAEAVNALLRDFLAEGRTPVKRARKGAAKK